MFSVEYVEIIFVCFLVALVRSTSGEYAVDQHPENKLRHQPLDEISSMGGFNEEPTQSNTRRPTNNIQQKSIKLSQYVGATTQSFQEEQNNFQDIKTNYQESQIQPTQILPPVQTEAIYTPSSLPVISTTFANKELPNTFVQIISEFPTTVQPADTTSSYAISRNTDLLEEDKKIGDKTTETSFYPLSNHMLLDSAPRCPNNYILVRTKCRLKV